MQVNATNAGMQQAASGTLWAAMRIKTAEFIKSAVKPSQYPESGTPEIAFIGRSNVGKSSLINTLVNRRRLARTSGTPGRTQLINFFLINEAITFVDLPGYGYAKVPVAVRKKWGPMIETYLAGRSNLKGVVLILDIRRTPGPGEFELADWMAHYHISNISVLTKADKLSRSKQQNQKRIIAECLSVSPEDLILFSAKTRLGSEKVWQAIQDLLDAPTAHLPKR
jgi:GTP-binding protein